MAVLFALRRAAKTSFLQRRSTNDLAWPGYDLTRQTWRNVLLALLVLILLALNLLLPAQPLEPQAAGPVAGGPTVSLRTP